jgi:hypothetical protein
MRSRYTKALLAITAVGAIAAPAIAQARQGSDDPVTHVRQEHHRADHRLRRGHDDLVRHVRHDRDDPAGDVRRGDDDPAGHVRHGGDDGPNHR